MLDSIRKYFGQSEPELTPRDQMEIGFHGLPHPKARAVMSPEKLAIRLSEQTAGTPAYILVDHELNIRIANIQAKAATRASYVGIVGVVVGVILTAICAALLLKYPPNEPPKAVHPTSERNTDGTTKVRVNDNIPTGNPSVLISIQTDHQATEKQKSSTKK